MKLLQWTDERLERLEDMSRSSAELVPVQPAELRAALALIHELYHRAEKAEEPKP